MSNEHVFPPLARPLGTRIRGVAADSEGGRLVPRADRVDEVAISARGAVASGPGFGWDRSGALELACGGMLSDGGMCAGSPGGRSPVRFPGVSRRGKAGFGGPSRCRRKLPLEGSRERAPLLQAGVRRLILCRLVVDRG